MLTRNWYNYLAACTMAGSTDTNAFGDGHINFKDTAGNIKAFDLNTINPRYLFLRFDNVIAQDGWGVMYPGRIYFGTGDTAESFDDYCLSNGYASVAAANFSNSAITYDSENKTYSNNITCVLTNTGTSDVTIKEYGIFCYGRKDSSTTTGFLAYREVLEIPFTIAAGESVNYTQNITFQYPTH